MGSVSAQLRMCLRVVVLLAVARFGLQAPSPRNARGSEVRTICPGYRSGAGASRDQTGCETGRGLGAVDHMTAFGFNKSHIPDWRSCIVSDHELPEVNHRVCFKTSVDKCGDVYRIFLKRRNFENMQRMCPNESEDLRIHGSENENRIIGLQSPRYGCTKRRSGNLYAYRRSELCLYNISIPTCQSNTLIIERELDATQELEDKADDEKCRDYLQFNYRSETETYCGNELSSLHLEIPGTEFMAVFWTDPADNRLGFKLAVRCKRQPLT